MRREALSRYVAAWLALLGLVLQFGLAAAHSARHFDHLVGLAGHAAAAAAVPGDSGPAAPDLPAGQDRYRCAIDFALAASGTIILGDPALVPLALTFARTPRDGAAPALTLAEHRHPLPPARAPPVIEMPV